MASIGRSGGRAYVYGTDVVAKVGRATAYVIASADGHTVLAGAGASAGVSTALGTLGNVRQPGVAAGIATVAGYTNFGTATAHGTSTALAIGYAAYAAIANATEIVLLRRRITPLVSTANGTSALTGQDHLNAISTAAASSVLSAKKTHVEAFSSSADATSSVDTSARTSIVTSTANATSVTPYQPLVLALVSTANAVATVYSVFVAKATYVSTANATSSLVSSKAITLSSSAAAASTALDTRVVLIDLSSSGVAVSVLAGSGATTSLLKSSAVASSVVSATLAAHQILLSTADATSHIIISDAALQAFWVNPGTAAAGTWGGMPFESMVGLENEMYAAGTDGIYRLETEADDDGVRIDAEVRWDLLRFDTPMRHRPGVVLLAGFSAGPLNVRVTNEQGKFDYPTHLDKNTKDSNLRAKLGKGLSSRYIRLAVTNPNGVAFSITDAQIEIIELSRRIGGKHG